MIVAAYNQRRVLPILLASLADQEGDLPFEVIVCDDGSSDGTAGTIAAWADAHPEFDIRYIFQPDRGFRVGRSRNNGIRCAQGQVLVFVDCDVWLAPFFLQDHWEAHQCRDRRLVCGPLIDVLVKQEALTEDWGRRPLEIVRTQSGDLGERRRWIRTDRPWVACTSGNCSIRSCDKIFFDEQFEGWGSEDRDFAFRAHASGASVHLLDRAAAVHIRISGEQLSWNPFKGGTHDAIVAALISKLRLAG